jgi:hypothetical protein
MITATEFRHVCCAWATRTEKYTCPAGYVAAGLLTPAHTCPVPDCAQASLIERAALECFQGPRRRPLWVRPYTGFHVGGATAHEGSALTGAVRRYSRKGRSPCFARLSIRTPHFTREFRTR